MQGTIDRAGLKIQVDSYRGITRDNVLAAYRAVIPVKPGTGDPTEMNRHVDAMWTGIKQTKPSSEEFEQAMLEIEILTGDYEYSKALAKLIADKTFVVSGDKRLSWFGEFGRLTEGAKNFLEQGVKPSAVLRRLKRIKDEHTMREALIESARKQKQAREKKELDDKLWFEFSHLSLFVERVQAINLQPNDLLVFKLNEKTSDYDLERTKEAAELLRKEFFPNNRILVTKDVEISVMRQGDNEP